MHVQEALDKYQFAPVNRMHAKHLRKSVRRQMRTTRAAEIEVTRGGVQVSQRTSPECSDPSAFVPPSSAEPPRPTAVRKHSRLSDLKLGIASRFEGVLRKELSRNYAEFELVDRLSWEAPILKVRTGWTACLSVQLTAAQPEEVVEALLRAIAFRRPLDRRHVHSGSECQFTDN
jgi:hypothetical protein